MSTNWLKKEEFIRERLVWPNYVFLENEGVLTGVLEKILKNNSLLILLDEERYTSRLLEIVKLIETTKSNVCYVCLNRLYTDVIKDLKEEGINTKKFFFIDVLSSHYERQKLKKNCIFLPSPTDLFSIKEAIKKTIEGKKCGMILFDTISSLLNYQQTSSIVKFTYHLVSEEKQENAKKLFIALKGTFMEEENEILIKDISMFADTILDLVKA